MAMVSIPASITVHVDSDNPTAAEVAEAVGKYVELRAGEDFDPENFEILG